MKFNYLAILLANRTKEYFIILKTKNTKGAFGKCKFLKKKEDK
jgi:hypothetical protein